MYRGLPSPVTGRISFVFNDKTCQYRFSDYSATKAPRHTCPPSAALQALAGGKNRPARHRPALRDSGEFPNSPEVIPIPPGRGVTRKQAGMSFAAYLNKNNSVTLVP